MVNCTVCMNDNRKRKDISYFNYPKESTSHPAHCGATNVSPIGKENVLDHVEPRKAQGNICGNLPSKKWLWCLLALQYGVVSGAENQNVQKSPPQNPSTVEAQAKFFQDFFSVQLSPYKIEFGHVCEDPNTWEQRYEAKDYKNHRDMGKVRWGDKKGGYGEHYWDLNHAGHNNNNDHDNYSNDNDDGSYHHQDNNENDHNDAYDEPSEPAPIYENDDTGAYDPEKASQSPYDEAGRAKRAHPRSKPERKVRHTTQKPIEESEEDEEIQTYRPRKTKEKAYKNQRNTQIYNSDETKDDDTSENDYEPTTEEPARKPTYKYKKVQKPEEFEDPEELKNVYKYKKVQKPAEAEEYVPEVKEEVKDDLKEPLYTPRKPQATSQFFPYEHGGGVKQHYPATSPPVPRLFLEPSTGHVVDRVTGQAYVLQPILANYNQ